MEKGIENAGELRDFVEKHKLRNRHSIIRFNSLVSIRTAKHRIQNEEMVVMITFDNFNSYGKLSFIGDDLDSYQYPTEFDADYQQIKHIDDKYLQITGYHKKNPNIGKYEVRITPLDILAE